MHHLIVQACALFNFFCDYKKDGVGRCIVVYAVFSTFAYLVNLLLASRFMRVSPRVSEVISALALGIYATCCTVNWCWQIVYIKRLALHFFHWSLCVFVPMLCMIVWDDLILMSWLQKNYVRMAKARRDEDGQKTE